MQLSKKDLLSLKYGCTISTSGKQFYGKKKKLPKVDPDLDIERGRTLHVNENSTQHDSASVSPPRNRSGTLNDEPEGSISPPRKSARGTDRSISPPRKSARGTDRSISPPRKSSSVSNRSVSPPRKSASEPDRASSPPKKSTVQDEPVEDPNDGRYAKTVYRNKFGAKENPEEKLLEKEKEIQEKEKRKKERLNENRGLVQREAEKRDVIKEISTKPFSRYRDDEDLNNELKQKPMWGDPMAKIVIETKDPEKLTKPIYTKGFSPNRFNIRPGYRWDGVDRSNHFEAKYFRAQNQREYKKQVSYKWTSDDM